MEASFSFSSSFPHLSLINKPLFQQLQRPSAVGRYSKLAVIEVVIWFEHKTKAFGLSVGVPVAQVILVEELVLHEVVIFEHDGEGLVREEYFRCV